MTPRASRSETPAGQRWLDRLRAAQAHVIQAERTRDELARAALEDDVGVRAVADALGVDKSTISRRYGSSE